MGIWLAGLGERVADFPAGETGSSSVTPSPW